MISPYLAYHTIEHLIHILQRLEKPLDRILI